MPSPWIWTEGPDRPDVCIESGCDQSAVRTAARCGNHLAEVLRREGEHIPEGNPFLERLLAAAIQLVRAGFAGVSRDIEDPTGRRSTIMLFAQLDPEAERDIALGSCALEALGAYLADEYGATRLYRPTLFDGRAVIPLEVSMPAAAAHSAQYPLRFAAEMVVRELTGPNADVMVTSRIVAGEEASGA